MKILFENGQIDTTDLVMIGELENFEDKNGNGTYKASYGHDDIIMTCVQIPLMQQTAKWENYIEDFELSKLNQNINNGFQNNIYNFGLDQIKKIDQNIIGYPPFPTDNIYENPYQIF